MTEKTTSDKTTSGPLPAPLPAELDTGAEDSTIRPFHFEVPEDELDDLRRRIAATRWPEKETVDDLSQGVQLAAIQALARYWETEYDWAAGGEAERLAAVHDRDRRARHPLHPRQVAARGRAAADHHARLARLDRRDAELIGPLTDPTAHGGGAEDAFHVVIPSMPGYGFSGKPTSRLGRRTSRAPGRS